MAVMGYHEEDREQRDEYKCDDALGREVNMRGEKQKGLNGVGEVRVVVDI